MSGERGPGPGERRYTVAALLDEVGRIFQRHWPAIWVEGEVTQMTVAASGHAYFTLRDTEHQLPVVMFRGDWSQATYRPGVGDRVLLRGRLGIFAGQGRYQLYANAVLPAGDGAWARELAARRARLERDGLLDPRRKRPLPKFPAVIGLATSPTGAALQDFLRVSRERYPAARILLAPCTVQGAEAPASVARAIDLLVEDGRAELIVVTRGGGSKSDLLAFQDEGLARIIATCSVPIVSAVGHEIDTSLTDLAADAIAPTPSAAALLVLPDGAACAMRVDDQTAALTAAMGRIVAARRRELGGFSARLRHPGERLVAAGRRRVELVERATRALQRQIALSRARSLAAGERLELASARARDARRHRLERARGRLEALSPLGVLERGYAIVTSARGVVDDPSAVQVGDTVHIRVRRGALTAVVTPGDG